MTAFFTFAQDLSALTQTEAVHARRDSGSPGWFEFARLSGRQGPGKAQAMAAATGLHCRPEGQVGTPSTGLEVRQ